MKLPPAASDIAKCHGETADGSRAEERVTFREELCPKCGIVSVTWGDGPGYCPRCRSEEDWAWVLWMIAGGPESTELADPN